MYKPVLSVPVDALGARFWFGAADRTAQEFEAAVSEVVRLLTPPEGDAAAVMVDVDDLPPALVDVFSRYFVEGVKEWEGVLGPDDELMLCSPENRQAIPTGDKVVVVSEYLRTVTDIAKKRGLPNGLPTSTTPPASSVPETSLMSADAS